MVRSAVISLAAAMLLAPPVTASPAIEVIAAPDAGVRDGLPAEVRATLASHLGESRAREVHVRLNRDGAEIRVDGKARTIPVADWDAGIIVWVIAVHAMDLATPEPALRVLGSPGAPRDAPIALFFGPRLGRGIDRQDPLTYELEAGATVAVRALRVSVAAGWSRAPTQDAGTPDQASFDLWPARLKVGLPLGPLELCAGAFVAPYRLVASGTHGGVTFGGGMEARWHGGRDLALGWFAGAGVDAFTRRATYEVSSVVFSTPRVAAYLTVGLTYRIGR